MPLPKPLNARDREERSRTWSRGLAGACLVAATGVLLWWMPLADPLTMLSYDLPMAARPSEQPREVVMLYLDERTFRDLNQSPANFSRTNHARVLRHLTREGARAVVYDIWLSDPHTPEENEALAEAMRENGRTVIAVITVSSINPGLTGVLRREPRPIFAEAAAGVGLAQVVEKESVVRRYDPGTEELPSLPWVTAEVVGKTIPASLREDPYNHWIWYYCGPGRFESYSLSQAESLPAGTFSNKVVFVGSYPRTAVAFEEKEEFRVPRSVFGSLSPGVDIWAHAFLNVVRGDIVRRWPAVWEVGLLVLTGFLVGWGMLYLSFRRAFLASVVLGAFAVVGGFYAMWEGRTWFCWSLVVGVQLPVGVLWAFWNQWKHVTHEKEVLAEQLATSLEDGDRWRREADAVRQMQSSAAPAPGGRHVPDHELLRRIGKGAYGEVWLARNAVGIYHAVKIIHRDAFDKEEPYEREFRGIEKFMPVSRDHPGLVHLLQVGRNDREGWFYYVMEAADDAHREGPLDPKNYAPKNLSTVLRRRKYLPADEAVELMLQLAEALHHLHERKLIHRDIKPANIIFVRGRAKLADIGLVTDVALTGEEVTCVGTAGYMAPEGPGTPAADLFSLGKVLFQVAWGMDPDLFPELPTGASKRDDYAAMKELNKIIGRACCFDVERRYRDAFQLVSDLRQLQV